LGEEEFLHTIGKCAILRPDLSFWQDSTKGIGLSQLTLFPVQPRLSKSKYVAGLQCHKRLYLEIHSPELATEPDDQTQAILDNGTQVGELARRQFPGGVLVEFGHSNLAAALKQTRDLVNEPAVPAIFEGAFQFDNVLIRADVLEQIAAGVWRLIEVKASTKVKTVHLNDLAVQTYVLGGCGVTLGGMRLMHLNKQYVYDGEQIDLRQLFTQQDLTAEVTARLSEVPDRLAAMKAMLTASSPPEIDPGSHCQEPYVCPFWEHCTQHKPARWIFYLSGGRATFDKLTAQGIETIDEIPPGFPLSLIQQRMKDNVEWVGPQLKLALDTVRYPVYHLDFETVMPAVPRFATTRPYQTLPFQWSNHVEIGDGTMLHDQYLCDECKDPREELAVRLLDSLGREGSICVYSDYERLVLRELAEAFPLLRRELYAVISRLWDLLPVLQRHYYHPQFGGSFSIKSVLPALAPGLDYGDLEIRDGAQAALAYERMLFGDLDTEEKAGLRAALLDYCKRDTLAMVEIRKVLRQKITACQT